MKIAMMTNNYKPVVGGVPISIDRLSNGLRRLGHEVTVFAPEYPGGAACAREGPDVVRYRILEKAGRFFGGITVPNSFDVRIEKQFARGAYDLIHVHHPFLIGYTALYLGRRYRCPVAFTYHTRYEQYLHYLAPCAALQRRCEERPGSLRGKAGAALLSFAGEKAVPAHMRAFSNLCDLVFAPTPMIKDYLRGIGVRSDLEVLPTGLGAESFLEDLPRSEALRKQYARGRKILLCTVARLSPEKNLLFLLRAVRAFKDSAGDCFRLLVIGDGEQRGELMREAARLGLGDNIIFTGNIDNREIGFHLRACDLFVFASKSETQGIVLLEAMAAGNPVIAVRATGVADVVRDGVNGLTTGEDEREWAAALERAVRDPALLRRMKRGALLEAEGYRDSRVAQMALDSYRRACLRAADTAGMAYPADVAAR